jgi:hypothetical protein
MLHLVRGELEVGDDTSVEGGLNVHMLLLLLLLLL